MPSSDDSSEISPSLAEFTAQSVPAATTVTTTKSTSTAPAAIAASDRTDRPGFPVTILGPTNSSNQALPNRLFDFSAKRHKAKPLQIIFGDSRYLKLSRSKSFKDAFIR